MTFQVPSYFKLNPDVRSYILRLPGSGKLLSAEKNKVYTFDDPRDIKHLLNKTELWVQTDIKGNPMNVVSETEKIKKEAASYVSVKPPRDKEKELMDKILSVAQNTKKRVSTKQETKHANKQSLIDNLVKE